ncbi:glycerol-3-phosphate responsive antiterminator, GlpP [Thermaerobacter marianensis DSM 12885]|uniref:Glycerol-3-phosphate responsive antiterminator, GlpP n=1 Tax=Thermaerobacter marianensis (strain ATCC 700841 / DSM 12885 / JCM 10246 / 7p75a) TaxID=644966 RepID=E6SH88_THEM7|nr:glycerol-3-phosphate responsive antiterminator [Thermaerobacter marianensis]ADU51752.1 glycerol-3-phosphate responsive antiterminator, GlpP [Thermaerobacter marianensis DSM 12885]
MGGTGMEGAPRVASRQALNRYPIIPAVRRDEDLDPALGSPAGALFLLSASLLTLPRVIERCRAAGKAVFVHYDLVEGLAGDRSGVEFLARYARPDGIITTRSTVARYSLEVGLETILRIFALDSAAVATAVQVIRRTQPGAVEVLPASLPAWVFAEIRTVHQGPLVAGGLVRALPDIKKVLAAGATAVSTSNPALWGGAGSG